MDMYLINNYKYVFINKPSMKKVYSVALDPDIVDKVKNETINFSGLVNSLLKKYLEENQK